MTSLVSSVHRHARRILNKEPRDLAPGEAQLFSFYAPSLVGGLHNISVNQTITAPAEAGSKSTARRETKIDPLSQSFVVVAPRFALPPNVVDSVYPTPGISVAHTVLPHIVLKDPHLPWSRAPSDAHITPEEDKNNVRSRTTWLALLVFSVEELQLSQGQIDRVMGNLPVEIDRKQSETKTLKIIARQTTKLNDIEGLVNTTGFDTTLDAKDADEPTEIILLSGSLFTDLFVDPEGPTEIINVSSYKYMAHVRKIATDGMANAGADSDEALFSCVVSPRTGPIDADESSMMIAHLVSLKWDKDMRYPKSSDLVAMTSLYSWTYTCLSSKNVASTRDLLTNLGQHLSVLRTGKGDEDPASGKDKEQVDLAALIAARRRDGYTLARHRTATGEITAAMLRGPLVPRQVKHKIDGMPMQSNYGHDLAIFDPKFGLMDTTYSNAWQLGRTLAMADNAFCAALTRLREPVHAFSLDSAKKDVHALFGDDGHGSRQRHAARMVDLVKGLNRINDSMHTLGGSATAAGPNRWCHQDDDQSGVGIESLDLVSQSSPHIMPRIRAHASTAALHFAMAVNTDGHVKGEKQEMYNEYNTPVNPHYAVVYSWVLDKIHLGNVPAHYLIPDPAFLPQETLRFFYLDTNWLDALVDGALSLANHWGAKPERDTTRTAIKEAINERLRTPDPALGGWHVQMPRYGFLLRSHILTQFPDLSIDVKFSEKRENPAMMKVDPPANTPAQQPILVQKRIAPDTMYLLLDAAPPDLKRITLTLPPHQQCFKIGYNLTADTLSMTVRKTYTIENRPKAGATLGERHFKLDGTPVAAFNWKTRTLNPAIFSRYLVQQLGESREGEFEDKVPTSVVTALQLNESILQLDIGDAWATDSPEVTPLFQLSTLSEMGVSQQPPPIVPRPRLKMEPGFIRGISRNSTNLASRIDHSIPDRPVEDMANQLGFDMVVTPMGTDSQAFIPTNSPVPIDLIFRLTRKRVISWGEPLTRIIVGVPTGDMPPTDNDPTILKPLLAANAEPSTPTMLGNPRLNVLKRYPRENEKELQNHVVFELVPREQPGVAIDKITNASFKLPRAEIVSYDGVDERTASIKVFYEVWRNGVSVREDQFMHIGKVYLKACIK
ncbi:hypothetical protein EDB82DRAFT_553720 [Fusarium venenatum]|uniref:uncharacterized protein n=1 Tax=Fusarium venenatum TaxID=56646 RepID=UPI001D8F5F90|nr:hypothetical protein EDB82DRAFT_553720 [Fusarium venenatum]